MRTFRDRRITLESLKKILAFLSAKRRKFFEIMVLAVLIPSILFYVLDYGYVDRVIFGQPQLSASLVSFDTNIEIVVGGTQIVNLGDETTRNRIFSELWKRRKISVGHPAYFQTKNLETNESYCVLVNPANWPEGRDEYNFSTEYKSIIDKSSEDGFPYLLKGNNRGTHCVDSFRINICVSGDHFINKEMLQGVTLLGDQCIELKESDFCPGDSITGKFLVQKFGKPPIKIVLSEVIEKFEVTYLKWNQIFFLDESYLHRSGQTIIPNCIADIVILP